MRAAVDVMGGDRAPATILAGCFQAAELLEPSDRVLLVGCEKTIQEALNASGLSPAHKSLFQIVATTEVIEMDDSPVEAIRAKPNSSISVMCKLAAKGEADVVISAGNTGALMALSRYVLKTLPGIDRPAMVSAIPTARGYCHLLDLGANVDCSAEHLYQFAVMGAVAAEAMGTARPRVALLNVGTEDIKGTGGLQEASQRLRAATGLALTFEGFVEADKINRGNVDVVVSDGFSGNIALKAIEGSARFVTDLLRRESLDEIIAFIEKHGGFTAQAAE